MRKLILFTVILCAGADLCASEEFEGRTLTRSNSDLTRTELEEVRLGLNEANIARGKSMGRKQPSASSLRKGVVSLTDIAKLTVARDGCITPGGESTRSSEETFGELSK